MNALAAAPFDRNERRRILRRSVGYLDDGRRAFPVHQGDTEDMARAVFALYDPDLLFTGQRAIVEWCCHSADYAYRHGCGDWCDNPSPRMVWIGDPIAASGREEPER